MAKTKDTRIETFRGEAMNFITDHFSDMEEAFADFMKKKEYGNAVGLYMQLVNKVIPSLPTQETSTATEGRPDWARKIDKAKKTTEMEVKDETTLNNDKV